MKKRKIFGGIGVLAILFVLGIANKSFAGEALDLQLTAGNGSKPTSEIKGDVNLDGFISGRDVNY